MTENVEKDTEINPPYTSRRETMSLAQVVYNISNDADFAALWRSDPDTALAKRGLKLSKEEQAFLSKGLHRGSSDGTKVRLSELMALATQWS
jgi:hypothetical protein